MAKKIKLTRPELKRQRDMMQRFQRYLPMLKLKQQQLQTAIRDLYIKRRKAQETADKARKAFEPYRGVLVDMAGINVTELSSPKEVHTTSTNIAGVSIPVFESVEFAEASYSLFSTPVWVDQAIADLRSLSESQAKVKIIERQAELLSKELTKVVQRVNLFEKIMIPRAKEIIRVIRIKLGDEMTAAVGRGKIAKSKLSEQGNSDDAETVYCPHEHQEETQGGDQL